MTAPSPLKHTKTRPEIIKPAVMYYIRYPLCLRQAEDIRYKHGIDPCHEALRFWLSLFSPLLAKTVHQNQANAHSNWRRFHPWQITDHDGVVFESFVSKRRQYENTRSRPRI